MPAASSRRQPAKRITNPLERYQRGRRIVELRAREKPLAWPKIAREVGLSERQTREVYDQAIQWDQNLHDPLAALDETIDVFTVAMQGALETFADAPAGSGVRVQALRTAMDAADTRLRILRAAGRAPRSLEGPSVAAQMQVVFRELAELLSRHEIPDAALRDFLELAERRMGESSAIEGTASEIAA